MTKISLTLRLHEDDLSVCKLDPQAKAPVDSLDAPFSFFLRTRDEATLVCPTDQAPDLGPDAAGEPRRADGWIPLQLVGPFAFDLTGILTQVANPLAEAGVSIYALSTFDTDYVLIKKAQRDAAKKALQAYGHQFLDTPTPQPRPTPPQAATPS